MPNLNREIIHFEEFYKTLFEKKIQCYEAGESPDFTFELSGKKIGVEHTQVFLEGSKDASLVAIESIGEDVARRVQLKGMVLPFNFNATLLFNFRETIKEKERERLATYIFESIEDVTCDKELSELEIFEVRPNDPHITSIRFAATMQELTTRVTVARAGWVKSTIHEEVTEAILKKSSKVEEYRKRCDDIWLLIVANGHEPSSLFDKQPSVLNLMCKSEFDKVYYLDFFDKELTEIIANG